MQNVLARAVLGRSLCLVDLLVYAERALELNVRLAVGSTICVHLCLDARCPHRFCASDEAPGEGGLPLSPERL